MTCTMLCICVCVCVCIYMYVSVQDNVPTLISILKKKPSSQDLKLITPQTIEVVSERLTSEVGLCVLFCGVHHSAGRLVVK